MKYTFNDSRLRTLRSNLRKNQTDAEKLLWFKLRNKQLQGIKFFRQYSVGNYILDFCAPKLQLAIELDGGRHNEQTRKQYDSIRTKFLNSQGIKVLRFWDNEVLTNIDEVLESISKSITPPILPLS